MAAYDQGTYEGQKRNALASYTQNAAMNAYKRYLAETSGQRPLLELRDAAFGIKKEVPRLTSSYGRRGLQGQGIKSGVYSKALSDYGTQRSRQIGYAQQDYDASLRGYDLAGTQLQNQYTNTLADIETQKARDMAADAAALVALR
jgi:hypothetical protein